jgi:hypothetical protein
MLRPWQQLTQVGVGVRKNPLFFLGLVFVLICIHVLAPLGTISDEEDTGDCLTKNDIALDKPSILIAAAIGVCTCVKPGVLEAYYNPLTVAVSAMAIPNLLLLTLLLIKYSTAYWKHLLSRFGGCFSDKEVEDLAAVDLAADAKKATEWCGGFEFFTFILNIFVGLLSLADYFTNEQLVPSGGGLCYATYATSAVMYRPVFISLFGALVVACDMAYWRIIEAQPAPLRRALGNENHPVEPPLEENVFSVFAIGVVSLMFFCWLGAAATFFPLAVPFAPIIFTSIAALLIVMYGGSELIRQLEILIDKKTGMEDTKVSIPKNFLVKAITAQLVGTVVVLATTAGFYETGNYGKSMEALWVLFEALKFDLTFDPRFALAWPEMPRFAMINFALALGVFALRLFVTNFFRVYYGGGLYRLGSSKIDEAFSKRFEKAESMAIKMTVAAVGAAYTVLEFGLVTAIAVDRVVLIVNGQRRFFRSLTIFASAIRQIEEKSPKELEDMGYHRKANTDKIEAISINVQEIKKKCEELQKEQEIKETNELSPALREFKSEHIVTRLQANHELFISMLEWSFVRDVQESTFKGITELSLSPGEHELRNAIGAIGLGMVETPPMPTLLKVKLVTVHNYAMYCAFIRI